MTPLIFAAIIVGRIIIPSPPPPPPPPPVMVQRVEPPTYQFESSDRGKVIMATDPSKGVWSYGPIKPSDVGKCLISPAYPLYWRIDKCP